MIDYKGFPGLAGVFLEDSYVLSISESSAQLVFHLDAVLTPEPSSDLRSTTALRTQRMISSHRDGADGWRAVATPRLRCRSPCAAGICFPARFRVLNPRTFMGVSGMSVSLRVSCAMVALVATAGSAPPAGAETLTEAFAQAYQYNPQLLAQRAQLIRAIEETDPSRMRG